VTSPLWRRYLRFIRADAAADVDDELEFHLNMRIERNIAFGMSPEDARRDALLRFGDLQRVRRDLVEHDHHQHRRTQRKELMSAFLHDMRFGLRSLKRAPGLTIGVVLTLALGLGVNMAMFTLLDVVFMRLPAGVHQPQHVHRVWTETQFRDGAQFWSGFSYPQYIAIQSALGPNVATALYLMPVETHFGRAAQERQIQVSYASASYFDLLGVRPALGRFYNAEEDRLGGGAPVAVASYAFWRQQLGADTTSLRRELTLAGRSYTLIGVASEGFTGVELNAADLWIPIASQARRGSGAWWRNHNVNGFQILLRPNGETGRAAVLEQRIAIGLRTPDALIRPMDTANVVRVGSIIRARGPGNQEQEVKIATRLAGVTSIVLVIACANVINLLLARAIRRRREVAVRLAIGISRPRLARLLFTESVLLALLATGAALIATYWGGALLRGLLLPDIVWANAASALHSRVSVLAIFVGIGAGLVSGILPVIQSIKVDLTGALKAGASDSHARRSRVRSTLVVVQAALSVVLLIGSGLFVSSLNNIRSLRTGFDTRQIVVGGVQFDTRDTTRDERQAQMFLELADRLRHEPGVEGVALARNAPTRGFSTLPFHPDVDTTQIPKPFATYNAVSPEFFATTGMRMLRGDPFPRGGAIPPIVVVNEAMAKAQWPGMDVLGRCLRFTNNDQCYVVNGVVETALLDDLLEEPQPQFYLPLDNSPPEVGRRAGSLVVRVRLGASDLVIAQMKRAIAEAFPGGRPWVSSMEQLLEPKYRPWKLGATLFTTFGLLALMVAALGIYSTVAYTVAQQAHEFGVRTAIGARTQDILRQVIAGSLRTVAIGVAVGIALAAAGGPLVGALLYGIEPSNPGVMMFVAVALLVTAAVAAFGPAWRAARVDPVRALRVD